MHAVAAMIAHVMHQEKDVRQAAVEGLSKVALPGDERVIAVVIPCLEDHDRSVRKAAAEAL